MTHYIGGAYDRCLTCPHLGVSCDGPNTMAMTLDRLHEWWRELKKIRGLSNAQIAEITTLSERTVARIMSGTEIKDISFSTASALNLALVGSGGEWPCSLVLNETIPKSLEELSRKDSELVQLRKTLDDIHSSYEKELEIVRQGARTMKAEAQAKIDHLTREIEHMREEARVKSRLLERLTDGK